MPLPDGLGTAKPLGYYVDHLDELAPLRWLYVGAETDEITMATDCYPVEVDSRELSEDEIVAFESAWKAANFECLLSLDQIRDIIGNLQQQVGEPTRPDVERAIDHYWMQDAFISLNGDVA